MPYTLSLDRKIGDNGCKVEEIANVISKRPSYEVFYGKYNRLAAELDISLTDLNNFQSEKSGEFFTDVVKILRRFVSKWSSKATVGKLCEGLRGCDLNDIADSIEEKFCKRDNSKLGTDESNTDEVPAAINNSQSSGLPSLNNESHFDAQSCIPTPLSTTEAPENEMTSNGLHVGVPVPVKNTERKDMPYNNCETKNLLQIDQRSTPALLTTDVPRNASLKYQCKKNIWYYILVQITIMLGSAILLYLTVNIYLAKHYAVSDQFPPPQTSCLLNSNQSIEDCITINALSLNEYSVLVKKFETGKCLSLTVSRYYGNDWNANSEIPNYECIYSLSLKRIEGQSDLLGYFLTNALMVKSLSLDCLNGKFEQNQTFLSSSTNKSVMLKSLSLINCDLANVMETVNSYANITELINLDIKYVNITVENVKEINNILSRSKALQNVSIHALNFEDYGTQIVFNSEISSLRSFVLSIDSFHDYIDFKPLHLNELCERLKNVSLLKVSLGYFDSEEIYHLNDCTELRYLEINVHLVPEEMDHLATDFHNHQLEKMELNLNFYDCPIYHKFKDLCVDISRQCALQSCTISSNCPVSEDGNMFSLSCYAK